MGLMSGLSGARFSLRILGVELCSSTNSYAEALTLSTSEYHLTRRQGLYEGNQVK